MRKEYQEILNLGEKLINIQKINNATAGLNDHMKIKIIMNEIKSEIIQDIININENINVETVKKEAKKTNDDTNTLTEGKQVTIKDVTKSTGVNTTGVKTSKKPVPKSTKKTN